LITASPGFLPRLRAYLESQRHQRAGRPMSAQAGRRFTHGHPVSLPPES
jgi:hypothetical protein